MSPKILTVDIETAPIEAWAWGLWEQNIGLNQIKTEWSILSYCAKWLDKDILLYEDTSGRGPRKVRDDKKLCKALWWFLNEADIVVAQNGAAFDVKKINARLLMHGFMPYSPIRVVDTTLVAKKHFGFTSNKLAWLSEHLTDTPKDEHRKFPGFELWKECLKDNPEAWEEMRKYNQIDVLATEKVYLRQRPWISGHPNLAAYHDRLELSCPKCGGTDLQFRGSAVSQVGRYQRFQCKGCGGWGRTRKSSLGSIKRQSLLAN